MPIRFHRQFTLFPGVKVNVSKTGMSITVGAKGFHLNFSKRGVMQTTNLPGKGLSHRSYLFKNNRDDERKSEEGEKGAPNQSEEKSERKTERTSAEKNSSPWGFFLFVFIALFMIYFGADALGLLPPNLITNLLSAITEWARQVGL